MSALPRKGFLVAPSNKRVTDSRRLGGFLDTLIAIRMDVGQSANSISIAASSSSGAAQMREIRELLDVAIASAKEMFSSIHVARAPGAASPFRVNGERRLIAKPEPVRIRSEYRVAASMGGRRRWLRDVHPSD